MVLRVKQKKGSKVVISDLRPFFVIATVDLLAIWVYLRACDKVFADDPYHMCISVPAPGAEVLIGYEVG